MTIDSQLPAETAGAAPALPSAPPGEGTNVETVLPASATG